MANILFDSLGVQVQVQQQTGNRLTTWYDSLTGLGYTLTTSDYKQPISTQLDGNDVLVILTRQWTQTPQRPPRKCPPPSSPPTCNPIPESYNFSYSSTDLKLIASWVQSGKGLLLFTNHAGFADNEKKQPPYLFPIYDISLAAAFGITMVYAAFSSSGDMSMAPAQNAPPALTEGVTTVAALDSGGILLPGNNGLQGITGQVIIPLPTNCSDKGPLSVASLSNRTGSSASVSGFSSAECAFAVLYPFGLGNVIVVGHSGIAGNADTCWPSLGQIDVADNKQFLNNCISYLSGSS